jgi:hypothetical protein
MRPAALAFSLAMLVAASCKAQNRDGVTALPQAGALYPPVPAGLEITHGTTIGNADTARFAFAEVTAPAGRRVVWLAEKIAAEPRFRILDVLEVPVLASDERLIVGLCGTLRDPARAARFAEDLNLDPEIVAIAKEANVPVITSVKAVWRGSTRNQRFQVIGTAGIACLNDSYTEG